MRARDVLPRVPHAAMQLAGAWGIPHLLLLDEVTSTNDVARTLAEEGAPHGTAVLADRQTAGRGRQGRSWHSPPGVGIWLSLVLRPAHLCAELLSLRVGLAAARALTPFASPAELTLKWPNDLLVGGRKLGGVLCEAAWEGQNARFVIAGVGVNALQEADDFPEEIRGVATSLAEVAGAAPERLAAAGALASALAGLHGLERARLDPAELRELEGRDALKGRRVSVESAGGSLEGIALGISTEGALRLREPGGRVHAVAAGSVRLADPPAA
jgi:BirA family transcriptional regulator, biotin operon repressor / biotin---[acetyl-CoA-carboxylase] ligase